jgi:hypothetical protein
MPVLHVVAARRSAALQGYRVSRARAMGLMGTEARIAVIYVALASIWIRVAGSEDGRGVPPGADRVLPVTGQAGEDRLL